ncbi:MAG: isoprenyl transferase [Chthonomonadales bacterium]|nr:isoprenyl transferase [Chthonomonadales bacterium]
MTDRAGDSVPSMPQHVAVIMDGNGRWARARGLERIEGHWAGYKTLKRIVYAADDLGIRYLTVYGFSSENWRRPQNEVSGLMRLMYAAMRAELEDLIENGIRVRVIGRLHQLPDELSDIFYEAMRSTEAYTRMTFTLAINYGGRAEIVDAVRAIARDIADGRISADDVDEASVAARLYAPEMPDPDLLIRTAGEMRLSNYLLWQSAYSEIWVTPTYWPDFTPELLLQAVQDYGKRTRRFGAVVE